MNERRAGRDSGSGSVGWMLLAPAIAVLGLLFVAPFGWLVRLSLMESGAADGSGARFYVPGTLTLAQFGAVLSDRYFHAVGWSTLRLALITGVLCLALAYPAAIWLDRARRPVGQVGVWLVALPKLTNALVLLYGVLLLLGNAGLVNRALLTMGIVQAPLPMFANLFAVVVGEALLVLPYPILLLLGVFRAAGTRGLEAAAQGLGAGPVRAFWETTFRVTLPGVALTLLVTLAWGAGAFAAPLVLGNPSLYTASVEIHTQTFERVNWPLAAALAICQMGLVAGLAGVALLIGGVRRSSAVRDIGVQRMPPSQPPTAGAAEHGSAIRPYSPLRTRLTAQLQGALLRGYVAVLLLFLVGPLLFSLAVSLNPAQTVGLPVGELSLRWYETLLADRLWLAGLRHSLLTAGIAVCIAVPAGLAAAVALDHLPSRWERPVTLLLVAPLFAPGVVLGLQSLATFQQFGLWGQPHAIGLAHAMWTLPLVFLALRAALTTVDRRLEEAAHGLGAHPARAFVLVTLPRLWPAITAAAFLCAVMSLNELPMALFLSTPAGRTLPTLIWPQLRYNLTPLVAAASGLLLLLTVGGLGMAALLGSRRWRRGADETPAARAARTGHAARTAPAETDHGPLTILVSRPA